MDRWFGKVAVVTGASSGIGLETAKALVKEGLTVVGLARRKDVMQERMSGAEGPGKFYPKQCDVASEEQVVATFKWLKDTFGAIHVLVNNAAVLKSGPIEEAKSEDLQHVINVNLMGLVYCSREAIKLMKPHGEEAHIVNVNSVAGHKVPTFGNYHVGIYSASKFATRSLTESLHHELLATKIKVSNVSPGCVRTEMIRTFQAEVDVASMLKVADILEPEDVAYFIVQIVKAPARVRIAELTIKPAGEPIV